MPFRWNHLKPSCRWNHRLNPFGIVWKLGTVHPLTNHHFLLLRFAKINRCICHMFNFSCGSRWAMKKQFRVFPSYYPIVFPSTIIYCYIVRHTPYIHYKSVINPFRVFPGYSPTRVCHMFNGSLVEILRWRPKKPRRQAAFAHGWCYVL